MSVQNTKLEPLEPQRSRLRALVADVESEVGVLVSGAAGGALIEPLKGAWAALVKGLALGPDPELRPCPFCRRGILQEASRCRYCLKNSSAAPPAPSIKA
jgi:hypothetical protein